jgi:5'(3')-deoxyribonucleotidase
MIIGVDIDNTFVNTGILWETWLANRFLYDTKKVTEWYSKYSMKPYNVASLYKLPEDCDGFEFWRDPNLYSGLKPVDGAIEALQELKDNGCEIIFISQAKGWHHKSKWNFIKKWFPENDGVVLTKEKRYVRCDYFIDDNIAQINSMPDSTKCFWFMTDYLIEGVGPTRMVTPVGSFKAFKEEVMKDLKGEVN